MIVDTKNFTAEQRAWLQGYACGLKEGMTGVAAEQARKDMTEYFNEIAKNATSSSQPKTANELNS